MNLRLITAALSGLLFGSGLILSGMGNPAKILAFLDLAGQWDPSLMLVMLGAILVSAPAFFIARRHQRAILGERIQIPQNRQIDRRLMAGSVLFGVGWGLSGFCPGPALVSLVSGSDQVLAFVLAMVVGMVIFQLMENQIQQQTAQSKQ